MDGRFTSQVSAAFQCTLSGLLLTIKIAAAAAEPPSPVQQNLLLNGSFAAGSGNSLDHWRTEAWISSPSATQYRWTSPANGQPGEVGVKNATPNDARWMQSLTLGPGWYYVSAEIRADKVAVDRTGASISLLEDGIMSPDLRGTTGWRRLGFYLRVGRNGADVEVGLRLGGFSSLNRGTAYFRDVRIVAIAMPPSGATPQFDLDAIRRSLAGAPIGKPWTLAATFVLLATVAYLGWRTYGQATLEAAAPRARRRARQGRSRG